MSYYEVHYTDMMLDIATRNALMLREPDYNVNEDGIYLTNMIWRWRGSVNLHVDDLKTNHYVVGAILQMGEMQKLVHGETAKDIKLGMVYVMDPFTYHGVLAYGPGDPLIAYISEIKAGEQLDSGAFMNEAMQAAHFLLQQPQPIFEDA